MNPLRCWIVGLSLVVLAPLAIADEPAKVDEPSVWMRKKLDYSQAILEGLAMADFDKIAKNARAMHGLSKVESFVRGRTPGYRTQLQIFLAANEDLIERADEDNLDGAALAFTQMTISCVNCHKQIRKGGAESPKKP